MFNNSVPYKISQTSDGETETFDVLATTYGPTIAKGAMVYYINGVFTKFVLDNLPAIVDEPSKSLRRDRDTAKDDGKAFSLVTWSNRRLEYFRAIRNVYLVYPLLPRNTPPHLVQSRPRLTWGTNAVPAYSIGWGQDHMRQGRP